MRKLFSLFPGAITLLIVVLGFSLRAENLWEKGPDPYWLAFTCSPATGPKCVMQIDALGNVTRPRTVIVRPFQFGAVGSGATAVSKNGTDKLNIWFPAKGTPEPIYRAVIDKLPLSLLSLKKTRVETTAQNFGLQVTHKRKNNFLTVQTGGTFFGDEPGRLLAFGMLPDGRLNGASWELASAENGMAQGGVSSDGKMAFFVEFGVAGNRLLVQPLGPRGKAHGSAQVIAKTRFATGGIIAVDISRPLFGETRFLIYHTGDVTVSITPRLVLQLIDSRSGAKIGGKIRLFTDPSDDVLFAALDPLGRFVVFAIHDTLVFQSLDANGHPTGKRKVLIEGEGPTGIPITGIDIVKE